MSYIKCYLTHFDLDSDSCRFFVDYLVDLLNYKKNPQKNPQRNLQKNLQKNIRPTSSYRATEWRNMSL